MLLESDGVTDVPLVSNTCQSCKIFTKGHCPDNTNKIALTNVVLTILV